MIGSGLFDTATRRVLVAPPAAREMAPGVPVEGGHLAFSLPFSLPPAALGAPRGRIGDAGLDEVHGRPAAAMAS